MEKVINILGVPYTVEEVECVDKGTLCKGQINYMTGRILIDKTLPKEHKDVVLMHEILHAVFDLLGYDDLATDESKVQGIATALHQVITSQKIFS